MKGKWATSAGLFVFLAISGFFSDIGTDPCEHTGWQLVEPEQQQAQLAALESIRCCHLILS
ncbi:hypothetical protein [Collimonas humicola]|uniref:hypothetical protein n=1 Tax=Collimonas humicola TaxID=2825886 RepID=UPI001B8CB18F|nr:hypothetical protein [Collimonas humicola]